MPQVSSGKPNESAPHIMCDNSQGPMYGDLHAYNKSCIYTLKLPIYRSWKEL